MPGGSCWRTADGELGPMLLSCKNHAMQNTRMVFYSDAETIFMCFSMSIRVVYYNCTKPFRKLCYEQRSILLQCWSMQCNAVKYAVQCATEYGVVMQSGRGLMSIQSPSPSLGVSILWVDTRGVGSSQLEPQSRSWTHLCGGSTDLCLTKGSSWISL